MSVGGQPGPVVVPLDGSFFSEVAIPMGRLLADTTGAPLHFVHVMAPLLPNPLHPEEHIKVTQRLRDRCLIYMRGVARVRAASAARMSVLPGENGVAHALAEYAAQEEASWVVLTTHGAGGLSRWLRGSVADGLLHRADRPLLFLRPWDATGDLAPGEQRFETILVPLDGSPESEAALTPAAALAKTFGSNLVLVWVVPSAASGGASAASDDVAAPKSDAERYLQSHVERLRGAQLRAQAAIVADRDAAEGIMGAALHHSCDLICMSSHGRGGLKRAVLGSVADRVLTESTVPLALVRPAEGRS